MKRRVDAIALAAVVLCALVVVGEALTYLPVHSYGASAEWDEDGVSYVAESSGSDVYDAVLIDNGDSVPVTSLAIYMDALYDDFYDLAHELTGVAYTEQGRFVHELTEALSSRSFLDAFEVGAEGLEGLLEDTLSDPAGIGVAVSSYALPTSVYDGTDDCLLMRWMAAGGTVYWCTSEAGRLHNDGSALHVVEDNQGLLFGTECLNLDGPSLADGEVDNGFLDALTLKNSDMAYAVDASAVEGAMAMGYSVGGYATIVAVPEGVGTMFVFSGAMGFDLIDDMAQVVASEVTLSSAIVGHDAGTIDGGRATGRIECSSGGVTLYIYVGGTFTKFGEAFHG